jgi:hypothetical protein
MAGLVFDRMTPTMPTEPLSIQRANILWQVFAQRVEPFVRIMFRWVMDDLRTRSTNLELQSSLTPTEHALVMGVCYVSINSLTNEECRSMLQLQRSTLLAECQFQCEESLLHTNLFCMSDLNVIRAVIFYVVGQTFLIPTLSMTRACTSCLRAS